MVKEEFDYYQGCREMVRHAAIYWPSDASVEPSLSQHGYGSVVEILAKHKTVLVISAGRGVFWSKAIPEVAELFDSDEWVQPTDGDHDRKWGLTHFEQWNSKYPDPSSCARCSSFSPPARTVCSRCLWKLKKWCGVPERKWIMRTRTVETQTAISDDESDIDTVAIRLYLCGLYNNCSRRHLL